MIPEEVADILVEGAKIFGLTKDEHAFVRTVLERYIGFTEERTAWARQLGRAPAEEEIRRRVQKHIELSFAGIEDQKRPELLKEVTQGGIYVYCELLSDDLKARIRQARRAGNE